MIDGVNIEEVKEYNRKVKEYRDSASKIQAGIEFNKKELNNICAELSKTLGIEVTVDNIESVKNDYIKKVQNTLSVGNEIIARIKQEEAMLSDDNSYGVEVEAPAAPVGSGWSEAPSVGVNGIGENSPVSPAPPTPPMMNFGQATGVAAASFRI